MLTRVLSRSGISVFLGVVAACTSPTDSDASRDVGITVDDVLLTRSDIRSEVSVPLEVTILNRGTSTLGYLGVCGVAWINPDASSPFSISSPCALVVEPLEIKAGEKASVSLLAVASAEEWGNFAAGGYTLVLDLFFESVSRAQLVHSMPFRVEVTPEGA